jgi:hypothetical protein
VLDEVVMKMKTALNLGTENTNQKHVTADGRPIGAAALGVYWQMPGNEWGCGSKEGM